jgi:hypothetical protein
MAASRKLYTAVAETIGREMFFADSVEVVMALHTLAGALADDFKQDNMSFDRTRFLTHIKTHRAKLEANRDARAVNQ